MRMDVRAARQRHVGRLRASTRVLRAVLFVVGHWWALGKYHGGSCWKGLGGNVGRCRIGSGLRTVCGERACSRHCCSFCSSEANVLWFTRSLSSSSQMLGDGMIEY